MDGKPIVARYCSHFLAFCPRCGQAERAESELEAYQARDLHRCPPEGGLDGLIAAVERALQLAR